MAHSTRQNIGMIGIGRMGRGRGLASWAGLIALIFQALYAVPASERMMLGEALSSAYAPVICFAHGSDTAHAAQLPGAPTGTKAHCPICYVAAFTALAAVIWLLAVRAEVRTVSQPTRAALLLPFRLSSAYRSRAPPALI